MVIEVRRTQFVNKGAELMLRAAVAEIRARVPDAEVVMIPVTASSYAQRGALGIGQKAWVKRYGIEWSSILRLVPTRLRRRYGIYLDSEVDVVLDAAGYAYGDMWPLKTLQRAADSAASWKRRGVKLVLLPQALGPFSGEKTRKAAQAFLGNADLVFARDADSYAHVVGLLGSAHYVKMAPDFTCLISGACPADFDIENNRLCVIPNYRMIDKSDSAMSDRYIDLMVHIVKYLKTKNAKPFLLIHEGADDIWLAEQINGRLPSPINIVVENNALAVKGIIGACVAVVSSRYHGIVNALVQGVPAVGTSWSHKYERLFDDFGFSEGVITGATTYEDLEAKLDRILDPTLRENLHTALLKHANQYRAAAKSMWDEIFSLIRS